MHPKHTRFLAVAIAACLCASAFAQTYEISWHAVSGGGGTSSGGQFSVAGTIGRPDAQTTPMSGGSFSVDGGFWPGAANTCTVPGDMNQDGTIDGDDIQHFVNCLVVGGACGCADLDGGGLGPSDVLALVNSLLGS